MTNTGGGNTSTKTTEPDPLTGRPVEVLWVKGSGGDLRTSGRGHFASLELAKLLHLRDAYAARPDRGPKSPAEDAAAACTRTARSAATRGRRPSTPHCTPSSPGGVWTTPIRSP